MRRLAVIGASLLDRDLVGRVERLCPDAPVPVVEDLRERTRPGGAGLAAALAAADGFEVVLVTALGGDSAGEELDSLLEQSGIEVVDLGLGTATPEKVRIRSDGRTLLRLDHGGRRGAPVGAFDGEAARALASAGTILVSDYGWGLTRDDAFRATLARLAPRVPVVWDPHPKGSEPVPGVRLATPNRSEAGSPHGLDEVADAARGLRESWKVGGVCVTLGSEGAVLVTAGGDAPPFVVPAPEAPISDPCGAGDRFASRAAELLAEGGTLEEAVAGAVESASAFVASGGAAAVRLPAKASAPRPDTVGEEAAQSLIRRVRERGGKVVATGGCFDLLHAGHVSVLRAARELGDCLVVCLNSDESVRRLKGRSRPLVSQSDRAAVISALGCVDAVVVFDEDTPEAVLERLRPDVWVKGGDYSAAELPEARLLKNWGGEAVLLPFLEGRSTTRLLEEARRRAS